MVDQLRDAAKQEADIARPDTATVSRPGRFEVRGLLDVACVLIGVAALVGWALYIAAIRKWDLLDLSVYHGAGTAIRDGVPLYQWRYENWLPFTYTPFAGLTFALLAGFTLDASRVLMTALAAASLMVTIWAIMHSLGVGRPSTRFALVTTLSLAAAVGLEPVAATISFGQVNLILMALVVVDLLVLDGRRGQGIGIGLAAAFKLTPALFIPYLLLTGRVASAVRATVTFGATLLLSFVLLPGDSRAFWGDRLFLDPSRTGGVMYISNQSINGALLRWAGVSSPIWLVALVAGWGLAVAVMIHRRGQPQLGAIIAGLVALLVSPVSWSHHWVWAVPAITFLLVVPGTWKKRGLAIGGAVVLAAVFVHPAWFWKTPNTGDLEATATAWQKAIGVMYPAIGIAALVGLTVWLVADARSAHTGRPAIAPERVAVEA